MRVSSIVQRGAVVLATLSFAPSFASAQVFEPRPDQPWYNRVYIGGGVAYAVPQGEFASYVRQAWGGTAHVILPVDREGVVALRADVGFLNYGDETKRIPLGGPFGGRIALDLNTTNNIALFQIGPQIMAPNGTFRPYVNGGIGFSYFFTQSSLRGTSEDETFANTDNWEDGTFSASAGAGVYVPLHVGRHPVSLDVAARYHWNGTVSYLRKGGIVDNPSGPATYYPITSRADFLLWHLGVSVGL